MPAKNNARVSHGLRVFTSSASGRRNKVDVIFDEMVCDVDVGRLTALKSKPAFRLLLRRVRGLSERDGVFEIVENG